MAEHEDRPLSAKAAFGRKYDPCNSRPTFAVARQYSRKWVIVYGPMTSIAACFDYTVEPGCGRLQTPLCVIELRPGTAAIVRYEWNEKEKRWLQP